MSVLTVPVLVSGFFICEVAIGLSVFLRKLHVSERAILNSESTVLLFWVERK
jgi:hypothetical protein